MPIYNGKYQKTYNLKKDHAEIKKQIKGWELEIDEIVNMYFEAKRDPDKFAQMDYSQVIDKLESISQDMMAINI